MIVEQSIDYDIKANHFLRSKNWANFRQTIGWNYKILTWKHNSKEFDFIIQLRKVKYLNKYIAYFPRGFEFLEQLSQIEINSLVSDLISFFKSINVITFKIDPDISHRLINKDLTPIDNKVSEVTTYLTNAGFIHLGFVNEFEGMQPRHTFRINTSTEYDRFIKSCNNSTRTRIKQSKNFGLEVVKTDVSDIDIFYNLLKTTSNRDDFTIRDINYYKNVMDAFGDMATLYLIKFDSKKVLASLNTKLDLILNEKEELKHKLSDINPESKKFKTTNNLLLQKDQSLAKLTSQIDEISVTTKVFYLGGGIKISTDKYSWYVYGASDDNYRHLLPMYMLVDSMVQDCINNGEEYLDMFGIGGSTDKNDPNIGLYDFKQGFGGNAREFIGEFDLPVSKAYTTMFLKVFPLIKKFRKKF